MNDPTLSADVVVSFEIFVASDENSGPWNVNSPFDPVTTEPTGWAEFICKDLCDGM